MSLRRRIGTTLDSLPLVGQPAADAARAGIGLVAFTHDWLRYRRMPGAEPLRLRDASPQLSDRLAASPYDAHYFQQAVWAAERIFANDPGEHVDVGSQLLYVGMLAARIPVVFVDIRPLELSIAKLRCIAGDVLALPFPDRSVTSLSSLHVLEHVGLGRYGDALNPHGTHEALAELRRVLAPAGSLFLSLPIGRPRVCFNAHRIHDPRDVIAWMDGLELVEFSAIDDDGLLQLGASLTDAATMRYGCGLFWFRGSAHP